MDVVNVSENFGGVEKSNLKKGSSNFAECGQFCQFQPENGVLKLCDGLESDRTAQSNQRACCDVDKVSNVSTSCIAVVDGPIRSLMSPGGENLGSESTIPPLECEGKRGISSDVSDILAKKSQ